MKKIFTAVNTTIVLFVLTIVLLVLNVVALEYVSPPPKEIDPGLAEEKINSHFLGSLKNVGIENEWIKSFKPRRFEDDGQTYNYKIDIPSDLPIPVVLSEVYLTFSPYKIEIESVEKSIGGDSNLKIMTDDRTFLFAKFSYNKNIERKAGRVGLIVTNLNQNTKSDSVLLNLPEIFAVMLIPSKASVEYINTLQAFRKEAVVLLNDDIEDLDYKLSSGYSKKRIQSSIKSLITDFSKAVFFVIDENSRIYRSPHFDSIRESFEKNSIVLLNLGDLNNAGSEMATDTTTVFENQIRSFTAGSDNLLLIKWTDLPEIIPDMIRLRKIGYKFINPSLIIRRAN